VSVTDQGIGIRAGDISSLFQPVLSAGDRSAFAGTGAGLYISQASSQRTADASRSPVQDWERGARSP